MENLKKLEKSRMFYINIAIISAICILNYFYQSADFDFTLKCICSASFALLGFLNLIYACKTKQGNIKFYAAMSAGLLLACLGDVLLGYDFIIGAGTFALGHICFVAAYCLIRRIRKADVLVSLALFAGAAAFLLLCPWLSFDEPVMKPVCLAYALIISLMLGKAIGNFMGSRNLVTGTITIASALFFFSDFMLVLDWFIGRWDWTDHACMGTYYPALCMLAFAMYLKTAMKEE